MITHQQLIDERAILANLKELIQIQARMTEISILLNQINLPPFERAQLQRELLLLSFRERNLRNALVAMGASLNDPPSELARRQTAYDAALEGLITGLDARVPLVLLPVRLETCFLPIAGTTKTALLLRIYPDDIHLDRHEPDLTSEERHWAKAFWEKAGAAGVKEQQIKEAWLHVASRFGTRRAAWIVHALNVHRTAPGSRTMHWNRAEQAACLPERWLVCGYREDGSRIFEKWTDLLPMTLQTGPDPQSNADADGLTTGMRWMHDFDAAVQAGMAIRQELDTTVADELRRIIVFGVKGTLDAQSSGQAFLDLLDAHHYTDGLALIPQGTPTNNTADGRAGQRREESFRDLQGEEAFIVEVKQVCSPTGAVDGNVLARALGVPSTTAPAGPAEAERELFPFAHIRYADGTDQKAAEEMNRVLWPALGRYFAEQMVRGDARRRISDASASYFHSFVRGRGPLPALRVGDQPYGLLPVSSLDLPPSGIDGPELIVLIARAAGQDTKEELFVAWDLFQPAGIGWEHNRQSAAWDRPQVVTSKEAAPLGAQLIKSAMCIADLKRDGQLQLAILRDIDITNEGQFSSLQIVHIKEQAQFGPSLQVVQILRTPGDEERLPAIAAIDLRGEPMLVLARLGTIDGYLRLLHEWIPGASPIANITWASQLPGFPLSISLLPVNLGPVIPGLALFSFIDDGSTRQLFLQTVSLMDILDTQTVNWSPPIPIPGLDSRLSANPAVSALHVALTEPDLDGAQMLLCVALSIDGQTIWRSIFVGIDFDLTSGGTTAWLDLSSSAGAPILPGTLVATAAAGTNLGPSPLPTDQRGGEGWFNLLRTLRRTWQDAAKDAPHLGRRPGQEDEDFLEVLGQVPASTDFVLRPLVGPDYLRNLQWVLRQQPREDYEAWLQTYVQGVISRLRNATLPALQALQLPLDARLAFSLYNEQALLWNGPLVDSGPLSERDRLADNYIAWLAKATPREIHDQHYPTANLPTALLYRLLRHATLQAYADAAVALWPPAGSREYIYEPEFVSMDDLNTPDPTAGEPATLTSWRYLTGDVIGGLKHDLELHQRAQKHPLPAFEPQPVQDLQAYLVGLQFLAKLPTAELDRLLRETLDLHSHRLDAWITSYATYRLDEMRAAPGGETGLHLGGYSWLEWDGSPLAPVRPNGGFIHAPSLGQATTAAILRSGYLSHNANSRGEILAVDLSSRRVRLALALIEGVRRGQPLPELLGQCFERALHDRRTPSLAQYIETFRELAPALAHRLTPPGTQPAKLGEVAARSVVHGLKLLERWREGKTQGWSSTTIPFDGNLSKLPASNSDEGKALLEELAALDDAVDAVADLAVADSVYQVAGGNAVRAGATLTSVSSGETPPLEPEVARTQRTGVGVKHRLAVLLGEPGTLASSWGDGPRAKAEPRLNFWAGQLLGDPSRVFFLAQYLDADGETVGIEREFSAAILKLCPLDVVSAPPTAGPAGRSDLEERALDAVLSWANENLPEADRKKVVGARLVFTRNLAWPAARLSVPEWLELARAMREVLLGARALGAADLLERSAAGEITFGAELSKRWTDAEASLNAAITTLRGMFVITNADHSKLESAGLPKSQVVSLTNLLDLPATADWEAVASALELDTRLDASKLLAGIRAFAGYGLTGGLPDARSLATRGDAARLAAQARRLIATAADRRAEAAARSDDLRRLEALFGGMRVLPVFSPEQSSLDAFLARRAATDAGPVAVHRWFGQVARIREGAGRLDMALLYAQAAAGYHTMFEVAQFPLSAAGQTDRWIGLQAMPNTRFPSGRTSIVCHTTVEIDFNKAPSAITLSGLLVDDWVETVPGTKEVTGLTFHYDAPGAQAPQAILLAVPPAPGIGWDVALIEKTLQQTLELAKMRAVDLETLPGLGHLLPALLLAQNTGGDPQGDTVATSLQQ
jgi:hypothetical protein